MREGHLTPGKSRDEKGRRKIMFKKKSQNEKSSVAQIAKGLLRT